MRTGVEITMVRREDAGSSIPNEISEEAFRQLCRLFHEECGIYLKDGKQKLLQGRLQKRMACLGIQKFEEYCNLLLTARGRQEELPHAIDAVTTNKTDFFREAHQFDFLLSTALPDCFSRYDIQSGKPLSLWSAACSSGEEPYSLAMVLAEYGSSHPSLQYSILATDISNRILDAARQGVYHHYQVEPIPLGLRHKYLLKSRLPGCDLVRVAPEIRAKVHFERLNLISDDYGIPERMDVIFCRNVIIYFDKQTQKKVIENLLRRLVPGGYLFMGHSETLNGMNLPLSYVAANVYRKGTEDEEEATFQQPETVAYARSEALSLC